MAITAKNGEIRRYRRFAGWDYAKGASLFVTMATEPRQPLFGKVDDGAMALSPLGEVVDAALRAMPSLNPGITLHGHVVMPDHVHFNCCIGPGLEEPLKLFGNAIRRFKNYTTKQAKLSFAINAPSPDGQAALGPPPSPDGQAALGPPPSPDGQATLGQFHLWQQGCHDYLLVSRSMIDSTERYIAYNPLKWALMHGAGALRIREPLFSPRLDPAEYWKGVGDIALLDPERPLVSLRVSREIATPAAIGAVVRRMEAAVDAGYAVICGFVSKGEQAVRDMLCAKPGARLIHLRPSCIPNARFRPESSYAQAFAENRCLELGRGNEEVAFSRAACLDVNAEIIRIALAGEGLALYFKEDGLYRYDGGEWRRVPPLQQARRSSTITAHNPYGQAALGKTYEK